MNPCILCGGDRHAALPVIGPPSMASDLRVVDGPLRKEMCSRCGLVRRMEGPPSLQFERGYALYSHAPTDGPERQRQRHYAAWIASALTAPPRSALDVGCGNGSLLLALKEHWPEAQLYGCDPSSESTRAGRSAGLSVWASDIRDLPADVRTDVIITVNVIEHTFDPLLFLEQLRPRMIPGGRLVIVCPDGGQPDVELLMADHVYSFTAAHLDALLAAAGWTPCLKLEAPPALGAFQMVVAAQCTESTHPSVADAEEQVALRRFQFLDRWRTLDDALLTRVGDGRIVCFGTGEAAGLLRAYAPRTWARVYACTADHIEPGDTFGALPLIALTTVSRDDPLLVAVRAYDQPAVAARLRGHFGNVVTWYDLVGA